MNIYLAGGAVRDLLMGNPISDRDYLVTDTTKEAFIKRFPNAYGVGKAFPVFLLEKLEFSFPRASNLDKELRSRDLTVNALLLDERGNLICHPNSLKDLHNKVLRPASPSSLKEDPLRVFRAARFWARFPNFTPHRELLEAMQNVASEGLLHSIAPDRIGTETLKAFNEKRPGNYLRLLAKTNCLEPWFTEFKKGINVPAGPIQFHDSDIVEHTCQTMDALAGSSTQVWMGMCHDLGKLLTEADKLPKHHGHDRRGIEIAKAIGGRIRVSNQLIRSGAIAAKWHMVAAKYNELRPGTRVDMLMELHLSETLSDLFKLVVVDQGEDHFEGASEDLATILAVKLPQEARNLGVKSGEILRGLRASALPKRT